MTIGPYLGHSRIADEISGFLDEDQTLAKKKDQINEFFSFYDFNTREMTPTNAFCDLGLSWWKQVIDAQFHKYDYDGMDKGFIGRRPEPGYFEGIDTACNFALLRASSEPLTSSYYKKLHKLACTHFDGVTTRMHGNDAGEFQVGYYGQTKTQTLFLGLPEEDQQEMFDLLKLAQEVIRASVEYEFCGSKEAFAYKLGLTCEDYEAKIKAAQTYIAAYEVLCDDRIERVNACIAEKSQEFGLTIPFAQVARIFSSVYIYHYCPESQVERIIDQLFAEFNSSMKEAETSDERILYVADLSQLLKWIRPLRDGQRRVDNVARGKILCDARLNPAILEDSEAFAFMPREECFRYLKRGIERWQYEFQTHPDTD